MQLGYNAPHNEDCEVRGNILVNSSLTINKFQKVVKEDNLVLAAGDTRPSGARVILRPNKYDPSRANLAIFNWEKKATVTVDASAFLKQGDQHQLLSPRDFLGQPVLTGVYAGQPIRVAVPDEFAAFVLRKDPAN